MCNHMLHQQSCQRGGAPMVEGPLRPAADGQGGAGGERSGHKLLGGAHRVEEGTPLGQLGSDRGGRRAARAVRVACRDARPGQHVAGNAVEQHVHRVAALCMAVKAESELRLNKAHPHSD